MWQNCGVIRAPNPRLCCVSQAAFHGVPIAALPFLAEQQENADKAVGRVCKQHHDI